MNEELDAAMVKVLQMVQARVQPDEAMKFSQAALNLAHVSAILNKTPNQETKPETPKKRASA